MIMIYQIVYVLILLIIELNKNINPNYELDISGDINTKKIFLKVKQIMK